MIYNMYKGEVQLEFLEEPHLYYVTDKKNGIEREQLVSVTSVTNVIDKSEPLKYWAARIASESWLEEAGNWTSIPTVDQLKDFHSTAKYAFKDVTKQALYVGSVAHEFVELYTLYELNKEPEPEMPTEPEAVRAIEAWFDWREKNHVEPLQAEAKVYSRKHRFSGTLDLMAYVNNELSIVDYKTSNGLYPEYLLQGAAYAGAKQEQMDFLGDRRKIEKIYVVRLGKNDAEFEVSEPLGWNEWNEWYEDVFVPCLKVYRWKKKVS